MIENGAAAGLETVVWGNDEATIVWQDADAFVMCDSFGRYWACVWEDEDERDDWYLVDEESQGHNTMAEAINEVCNLK